MHIHIPTERKEVLSLQEFKKKRAKVNKPKESVQVAEMHFHSVIANYH